MVVEEIMSSIVPKELHDEFPTGFSVVGHVGRRFPSECMHITRSKIPNLLYFQPI